MVLSPGGVTAHSDDNLKRVVVCIVLLETQKVAFERSGTKNVDSKMTLSGKGK